MRSAPFPWTHCPSALAWLKEEPRRCATTTRRSAAWWPRQSTAPARSSSSAPTRSTARKASLTFAACFPGESTSAATCGPGPGVDRVEDVTAINLPDASAGTVLCIETFEHVFEVRQGVRRSVSPPQARGRFRDHVAAQLSDSRLPGRLLADDPQLPAGGMLEPYAARLSGFQGYHAFPHTVMGIGMKAPVPLGRDRTPREDRRRLQGVARAHRGCAPFRRKGAPERLAALPLQRRASPDRQLLCG